MLLYQDFHTDSDLQGSSFRLRQQELNPINTRVSRVAGSFNKRQSSFTAYCYARLAISFPAVVVTTPVLILPTHDRKQAELSWVAN